MASDKPLVLLTGGTGYIGGRLLPLLERRGLRLRCLIFAGMLRALVRAAEEKDGRPDSDGPLIRRRPV